MEPLTLPPGIALSIGSALPKDLEGACRALEQEFVTLVFRKMREAMVPKSSDGTASFARETTQSMLDLQWAQLASQGEGLGLWRTLYRELEPRDVKSDPRVADERAREETHRMEAANHAHAKGSVGAPGPRMGHPQTGGTPEARQGVHGLPLPAAMRHSSADRGERKGL